jgi:dethiobiotin synthetase
VTGYFITGTDTDVGKTFVTCALARRARARGCRVFAFKPIESGCVLDDSGRRIGADQELLVEAAGGWQQGLLRGIYQLALPAAPLVAADAAGVAIDLSLVTETARGAATRTGDTLALVEGAGGWRVPISLTEDMSTLARLLGLPIVVVARAGLGTINHTLLTVEAIARDGLEIAAVVLSQRPEDELEATSRNRLEILRRWDGQVLVLGNESVLDPLIPSPTFHVEQNARG